MARSKSSQSKHDAEVRRQAKRLEKQGFDVSADLKGYKQPRSIGGYRPDVVAKKGGQRKIVEVETPDSVATTRDQQQQQAFRRSADRSNKTTFRRIVTKSKT